MSAPAHPARDTAPAPAPEMDAAPPPVTCCGWDDCHHEALVVSVFARDDGTVSALPRCLAHAGTANDAWTHRDTLTIGDCATLLGAAMCGQILGRA